MFIKQVPWRNEPPWDNRKERHNNVKTKTRNKEIDATITLYKIGKFYNTYNDSAIILNYLFGYKTLIDNKVGFP